MQEPREKALSPTRSNPAELQGRGTREKRLEPQSGKTGQRWLQGSVLSQAARWGVGSDSAFLVGTLIVFGIQRGPALFLCSFHSQLLGRIVHHTFE